MQNPPHASSFGIQTSKPQSPESETEGPPAGTETPNSNGSSKSWRDRLPRGWPYWLAGLSLAGLSVFALRPTPVAVDLGTVESGTLWVTVDAEGQTRVQDRYVIAAPVAGRLTRIELASGDSIEAGAVVAQIEALPFNTEVEAAQARLQELNAQIAGVATQRPKAAALAQAKADINATIARQRQAEAQYQEAQASLTQAQRDRDRAQDLQTSGAISRQAREDAELAVTQRQQTLETAQQQVAAATANVAAARDALKVLQAEQQDPDYLLEVYQAQIASTEAELLRLTDEAQRTTVTAPASGEVLRVMQESARFVQAGDPLLEVGNAAQLELVIDILSTDAVQVELGDLIQIEHWGGEETLQGRVRSLEPSAFTEVSALGVEEQRVNVIADLIDPPAALGDGYRVEAQIVTWAGEDVVMVPMSALFRCDPQTWCTFVAEAGKAQQREIVISQRNDLAAAVESGLTPGEQVILHPSEEIGEGKRVRDRD
ncbi:MAG: HlyD family efflux transporter periplasmic adaptor subunit [Leptolyngbya sp. RL_3_1]|nr:HlyD family efflux transporter periplasmic adaptor subunit [Leptolyngbya sp. RL_3_1]